MKALLLALSIIMTAALLAATPTFAEEYYALKSRSGVLRMVDHQPKGGATIVKGPFHTRQEADKAIGSAPDSKGPDINVK